MGSACAGITHSSGPRESPHSAQPCPGPAASAARTELCFSTSSRKVAEKLNRASFMALGSTRRDFLPPSSPPSAGAAAAGGAGAGTGCLLATSRIAWMDAATSGGIS